MNQEMKIKREELKALSVGFKILLKEGAINSVNEGLANYYAELGHKILKSYKRWREEGYQVKRGSKALLLWGEPQNIVNRNKPAENQNNDSEKEDSFFPLAYVFSNLQVEPMQKN